MFRIYRVVLGFASLAACGLQRDYEAFLKAAKGPTEGSESSGDGVPASSDAGASMGTTSHGETGAAGVMTGSGGTTDTEATAGASGGGTSTGGTSTGGGEAPYCGDGVVNQPFEECDDGNLDETDRCAVTCHKIRLLFVTSTLLQGKMSGLAGADAYCKSLALAARQEDPDSPIEDPGNFKALLSSSTQSIWDRHYDGK